MPRAAEPGIESAMVRLAVLLSGSGTTLQAFLDAIAAGRLDARVDLVLASRADAYGLERARAAGIAAVAVPRKQYPDVADFNDRLHAELDRHPVDLILLAGFLSPFQMRGKYAGRVMNTHPALIPAFSGKGFYGHHVHEAAIAAGVRVSGCTIHFADEEYDHGPIILQRTVAVEDDDTADTLAAKVQAVEKVAYLEAVELFAAGRLHIDGRRVRIRPR